jgi:hypothetical protein
MRALVESDGLRQQSPAKHFGCTGWRQGVIAPANLPGANRAALHLIAVG